MTVEDYIAHVTQLIQTNLNPLRGYITVAVLGERLKRSNLEVNWKTFGYPSLLRLLEDLERRNLVSLRKTEKDALAVAPFGLTTTAALTGPPAIPSMPKTYNALRKSVWAAFVFTTPEGRRFIHRASGVVRMGLQQEPTPIDEWSEIQPIPEDLQKEWAASFAAGDAALLAAMHQANWHTAFPNTLMLKSHSERAAWNRHRSVSVSRLVEEWALAHSYPKELLFEPRESTVAPVPKSPEVPRPLSSDEQVRRWLLAAISQLSTEQLLAIPITGQLLLSAMKSEPITGSKA